MSKFQRFVLLCNHERGAAMVEYALLLALIAAVAIGAIGAFGSGLGTEYSDIGSTITSAIE